MTDLVVLAVQGEGEGLLDGTAVEVVLEVDVDFLSHGWCSFRCLGRALVWWRGVRGCGVGAGTR
jgi:hypothetical protein